MPSAFSQSYLATQITKILGDSLSNQELENCIQALDIIEPPIAKQFWISTTAPPGIYLVLSGKVRLLDGGNNLISTLTSGSSFGELTLFPEQNFSAYVARASVNLKVGYLHQEVINRFAGVSDRLFIKAELWDILLLLSQNSAIPRHESVEEILTALSLFAKQNLEIGSLNPQVTENTKLLLVCQGELQHSQGKKLTPGNIYVHPHKGKWQATQPSRVYILHDADLQTALQHWPQLSRLIDVENEPITEPIKREVKAGSRNVIQFPQTTIQEQSQPKQSQKYFPSPTVTAGNWWRKVSKRYPFCEQQSASDCGAACLVMISRYWGKNFTINRLRELANINRAGASMRSLTAAAESIGFATRPVKASLDKLAQQTLPAIAHWEGKHYIVVYEITEKLVIVADPAIGQLNLSIREFKAGWTGYALLLQPTNSVQTIPEANTPFWQLFELVKPHSHVLLEVFVASVLIQVFGLVTPLFTQLLLDRVIVQGSTITLNTVGFGLLIFTLFRVVINGLRQYLLDHTANRISVALMVGFIKHTFRLPLSFFESRYVGDIVSRVQENQKIQRFLTGEALSIVLDFLTVFIYISLMFWYSPSMALLVLAIVPPFVLLALFATPFLRRTSREVFTAVTKENSYLIQSLTGISSIRSMAIEQTVRWRWEELLNNLTKKNFSVQVIGNQLEIISSTIQAIASTGLLWFGAWLVIQNQLTIGQLVAFNMLLGNVIQPFQRLISLWNQLQEVIVSTERINDVLEARPEEDLAVHSRQILPRLRGHLHFDNVTFRYHAESDINILENLSFEILPEQTVAVVGRSGSGKTTLSKLILGLYPATDGRVLIDNQDVASISLHSLRSQIGVVDQDTFLFGGTIRENISIAHPEATLEEIIEAAQLAGADEFIKRMAMGYETQIGEGGGMLSGGQRQRLAIARALLGSPRLLILDEATSHLDAESERIIQNNLKTILKGRTSFIIAHRLSTVRHADLILVLDRGILVESGTHEELILKRGHYYYLNQQQLASTG
jgi:ATP-binding cassette subfamily B protein